MKCVASGLKLCSSGHDFMQSVCSKTRKGLLKRRVKISGGKESYSSDDDYENCISSNKKPFQIGDYVKNGLSKGLYVINADASYEDEPEIKYF